MKYLSLLLVVCFLLLPFCASSEQISTENIKGRLLLSVVTNDQGDREEYLEDIASTADAFVARVYSALSPDESSPILLLIYSKVNASNEMMAMLKGDARVLSMSQIRKAGIAKIK